MSIIWDLHKRFRSFIPDPLVRIFRKFLERNFDKPWEKKIFSQFGEDATFQAILGHIAWRTGMQAVSSSEMFYVNIGAFAPKQHSNTYSLYKKGWNGINIDASPGSMKVFNSVLKRDINIEALVSNSNRSLTFFCWSSPNVMNTVSAEEAKKLEPRLGVPKSITMTSKTLAEILERHLPTGHTIGLLSLDVESHNLAVLQSNDWTKYQPTFIIVEFEGNPCSIEEILNSELSHFLNSKGYVMSNWVGLSLFFSRSWPWN